MTKDTVDLQGDPYAIFIRLGLMADASRRVRKMFTVEPALYGSQTLLDRYGTPEKPEDILSYPCISLLRTRNSWIFCKENFQKTIFVPPAYAFSSIVLCHEFAAAGRGVTMLRKNRAAQDEKKESLSIYYLIGMEYTIICISLQ